MKFDHGPAAETGDAAQKGDRHASGRIQEKWRRSLENHAASFALLVYSSAWLRHHEPAVFLATLLKSQQIDSYTPSQLLLDARRRGVEVLPVDVHVSTWDSAIEGPTTSAPVRLGFSLLNGMREDTSDRI
ncbi:DNA polymerase-3 subunit alpha/error-prone DNA polymerase [Burkholderia pyrrocinia]|uniref:DNA polymerase-3 subunit alpha/error-prone DNA polymerase n=1 Tax=Burkholderia pyrrocinia TaxID=60550 RepID=A0A318HS31_BURPY|nr:DNA polymerase-3 subunit alpha/error-prone DNA polymerase [Burkholderia pyrrocinia]SFW91035.1 Helix-hairpin-helix motif-containing protein [Burkholderia sp. NFACC33-1]SFY46613.1 Helix-hairpin-helix motif-containing protein [Burkholderia sp. NFPP32]